MSMLKHAYNIIIDISIRYLGHCIEVVDSLNNADKRFISILMSNVKLLSAAWYDTQMAMKTSTPKYNINIARGFQKRLSLYIYLSPSLSR